MSLTDEILDEISGDLSVQDAIAGEEPEIREPEDPTVELPRGILHEGAWQSQVELRELTGADEERLAKYKTKDQLLNGILALGVERVGSIALDTMTLAEREVLMSNLLIGERMVLILALTRLCFGDKKPVEWVCPECEAENETDVYISEDFKAEIPDDIHGPFFFIDSKGRKIAYRGVTGGDVMKIAEDMSPPAANSLVLSSVILSVDGQPPFDAEQFVKELSMRDRRDLLEAVNKVQPVVDMNLVVPCHRCGKETVLPFTWERLFLA